MWNKLKEWFNKNWKSFTIAVLFPIGFTILILLFDKWLILILWLAFIGILGIKIWKNQPF